MSKYKIRKCNKCATWFIAFLNTPCTKAGCGGTIK